MRPAFFRFSRRLLAGLGLSVAALSSGTATAAPVVGAFERFYAGEQTGERLVEGGLLLLNELNCVACHAPPAGWAGRLLGRGKISLVGVGQRLDAAALRAFVLDPHRTKGGTTMPASLAGAAGEADAIATYLASLVAPPAGRPAKPFPPGDAGRGGHLYTTIGCVTCHAPADGQSAFASVPIALARQMPEAALANFLQDPLHTRPAARMPAFPLSDAEAADLAAYLRRGAQAAQTSGRARSSPGVDGRAAFKARNCAACHEVGEAAAVTWSRPLQDVQTGRGCIGPQPAAGVPDFALSAGQVRALAAAVQAVQTAAAAPPQTPAQRVAEKFAQLNCYACHEWRGAGGVEEGRARGLSATDGAAESLGEFGRLPPKLDQAGRKLTPLWLEKLLAGKGGGVRPYLSARMPRVGHAHAAELIPLLAEACRPERAEEIDTSGTKGHQRSATGRLLIGTGEGGLGCVACHGLRDREPTGVRAINLTHTAQRLRPEYFKALLIDPQGVQPGTTMPPLFAGRKNAAREVESLWTYLKELDQNPRLPDGLIAPDSFELKPENEGRPVVFRTFLRGAGTHAIAVGFPARVHVAFDAYEVRWALAWRGRFLDALSNWEERANPPVAPLGDDVRTFAAAMPLAKLRDAGEPWPAAYGAAAGYVFKSYRLGPDRVPTFRYAVGGLEIEDTFRPDAEGRTLRRSVLVRGGEPNWYFRGLPPGAVPQPVVWRDGVAVFEETLSF